MRGVVGADGGGRLQPVAGPLGREACLQAAAEAVALAQVAGRMVGVEAPLGIVVTLRSQGQDGGKQGHLYVRGQLPRPLALTFQVVQVVAGL